MTYAEKYDRVSYQPEMILDTYKSNLIILICYLTNIITELIVILSYNSFSYHNKAWLIVFLTVCLHYKFL